MYRVKFGCHFCACYKRNIILQEWLTIMWLLSSSGAIQWSHGDKNMKSDEKYERNSIKPSGEMCDVSTTDMLSFHNSKL